MANAYANQNLSMDTLQEIMKGNVLKRLLKPFCSLMKIKMMKNQPKLPKNEVNLLSSGEIYYTLFSRRNLRFPHIFIIS